MARRIRVCSWFVVLAWTTSVATQAKPPAAYPGEEAAVAAVKRLGGGGAHPSGQTKWASLTWATSDVDVAALRGLARLESVDFIGANIGNPTAAILATCPELRYVELAATPITDDALAHLAKLKHLRYLSLTQTAIGDAGLANLGDLPELVELILNDTPTTDAGFQHLIHFPKLEQLSASSLRVYVDGSQFGGSGEADGILTPGRHADGNVQQRVVSDKALLQRLPRKPGPHLTDRALEPIGRLKNLKSLDLSGTPITDAGLRHVAGLTNLETLTLTDTKVTDAGLVHLAGMSKLTRLVLTGTPVADAGLSHLAKLPKLEALLLDRTKVGDAGLAHLAGSPKLAQLNLTGTQITDAGLVHFSKLPCLQSLTLDRTKVTDAGMPPLARHATLSTLSLDRTGLTSAGLDHFDRRSNLGLSFDDTGVGDKGQAQWRGGKGFDAVRPTGPAAKQSFEVAQKETARLAAVAAAQQAALERLAKRDVTTFLAALEHDPELVYARLKMLERDPAEFGPRPDIRQATHDYEMTPLHIAALHDDLSTAELLLRRGASARATTSRDRTPLTFACSAAMVDLLVDYDAEVEPKKERPMGYARNAETAAALLRRGAYVLASDEDDHTALEAAVGAGRIDVVRFLLKRGANLRRTDESGWTPLHIAAHAGNLEMVRLLLEKGADLNAGEEPRVDFVMLATALIDPAEAAEMQKERPVGMTPLAHAFMSDDLDVVRYLISQGARFDFRTSSVGFELLAAAVEELSPKTVRFMLDHGAKHYCRKPEAVAILTSAIEEDRDVEIIRMLLDAGVPVDAKTLDEPTVGATDPYEFPILVPAGHGTRDLDGWTPLHFAAGSEHLPAVELLLERGADAHAKSIAGLTPLDLVQGEAQTRSAWAAPLKKDPNDPFPDAAEVERDRRNEARAAIRRLLTAVQASTKPAAERK